MNQVLLVDDNPTQLAVREAVLRNAGFQVSLATTVASALATVRVLRDHIGVVVTDHLMPDSSGLDLVRQLRASNNWVAVIVLSGLAEAEADYHGLQVIFRPKPLPPPELIELVRESLAKRDESKGAA